MRVFLFFITLHFFSTISAQPLDSVTFSEDGNYTLYKRSERETPRGTLSWYRLFNKANSSFPEDIAISNDSAFIIKYYPERKPMSDTSTQKRLSFTASNCDIWVYSIKRFSIKQFISLYGLTLKGYLSSDTIAIAIDTIQRHPAKEKWDGSDYKLLVKLSLNGQPFYSVTEEFRSAERIEMQKTNASVYYDANSKNFFVYKELDFQASGVGGYDISDTKRIIGVTGTRKP